MVLEKLLTMLQGSLLFLFMFVSSVHIPCTIPTSFCMKILAEVETYSICTSADALF